MARRRSRRSRAVAAMCAASGARVDVRLVLPDGAKLDLAPETAHRVDAAVRFALDGFAQTWHGAEEMALQDVPFGLAPEPIDRSRRLDAPRIAGRSFDRAGDTVEVTVVESPDISAQRAVQRIVIDRSCYARPGSRDAGESRVIEINVAALYEARAERDELVRDHAVHERKCGALARELDATKCTRASRKETRR